MKMTTKAMVKMSACPLQCLDISETKNGQDNSMNEEGANVRAEGKLRKHQPFTGSYLGATII